jgi:hypothetical protein
MPRSTRQAKFWLSAAAAFALTTSTARADVVITEKIDMDGAAGFSMLAMAGQSTSSITPDKSRIDSDMKFKSRLMNTFAGKSGNSSQIIRLDKGVVYDVQHADKKYTEMTFAQMRAAMQKNMEAIEQASQAQAQTQQQQLPVDAEECQWSPPVVEARETGEHATIAGFDTARATVSVKQTCTDPKTSKACDMVWTIDQWLSSQAPGADESKAFALNYAQQLGIDAASMKAMQGRMQQAYGEYKSSWTEAMDKASQFQGYPLKTALQMTMGGAQCTTESGTQVAADPVFADAVDAGMQAGASTAAGAATSAATQTVVQQAGGGVAGAVAGSAAGAFAGKLGASLMGKLKKKDKEPPAATPEPAAAANPGMIRLFRMQTETVSVQSGAIPGPTFDVPAGYKKVAAAVATD